MTQPSVQAALASGDHPGILRRLAGGLARSRLLRGGQQLYAQNERNWNLPLSKAEKLWAGSYIILHDYALGAFPPRFPDRQEAYQSEIDYWFTPQNLDPEAVARGEMAKPFWFGRSLTTYLGSFTQLTRALERIEVRPPARLLELGGGSGWTAEFLAQLGFKVLSTTISPHDVKNAQKRVEALRVKGLLAELEFRACPMESVAPAVADRSPFDAVFVFEALHHAFDWRAALESAFQCLRPGGWLLICAEPNVLHTFISYRVARLSKTHEIGFRKTALTRHLKCVGFKTVLSIGKRPHLFVRPHWLLARK